MTIADKVKSTDLYQSGRRFTCPEMARAIDTHPSTMRNSLETMVIRGDSGRDVLSDRILYWKPTRHWIHSRRLA